MSKYKQIIKNLPDYDNQDFAHYLRQIEMAKNKIISQLQNQQIDPLNIVPLNIAPLNIAPLNIAFKSDDLDEINDLAKQINKQFKQIVILGVGGSSLGAKTLTAITDDEKLLFMESIDANTIAKKLAKIDLKNALFLVISKSGETIETICQTLILLEKFQEQNHQDFSKNFIFITENKNSSIGKIALEIGSKIFPHPQDIGGRFSYLCIVGLLPAAICGLDIKKIRNGAKAVLKDFLTQKTNQNHICQIAASQLYLFDKGFNNNVIMPYIDVLKDFTDWYRQLWAESLGKNSFGSTPITSMGTVDQHSQLQLYLDGPKDKFFTFITNKGSKSNFLINDLKNCPTIFDGKNLSEIVKIEQDSTIEVLNQRKLPIRILELPKLDEEILSALMMQMFLETILIAFAKNINPFDQPAVELRKELAKLLLS